MGCCSFFNKQFLHAIILIVYDSYGGRKSEQVEAKTNNTVFQIIIYLLDWGLNKFVAFNVQYLLFFHKTRNRLPLLFASI